MLQANLMGLFVDDVQAGDLWHSVVNLGTAEIVKTSLPDFAGRDRSWRIEQTKLLKVFSRVVVKRSVNFADDQINAPAVQKRHSHRFPKGAWSSSTLGRTP